MKVTRFEWDLKKAASNLVKHKISFEQAIRAFDDPFALIAPAKNIHKRSLESGLLVKLIQGFLSLYSPAEKRARYYD